MRLAYENACLAQIAAARNSAKSAVAIGRMYPIATGIVFAVGNCWLGVCWAYDRGARGLMHCHQTARHLVKFVSLLFPPRIDALNFTHLLLCDAGGRAFPYADVLVVDVAAYVVV